MKKVLTLVMTVVFAVSMAVIPSSAATERKFKLSGKYGGDGGLTLLSWNEYPNAENYRIQMRYHGDEKWVTIFKYDNDKFSFQQMRPRDSEKYQYRVVAVIGKKGYATNKLTIKGQGIVEVDDMFELMLKKKKTSTTKTDAESTASVPPSKIDETSTSGSTEIFTEDGSHIEHSDNTTIVKKDTNAMAYEILELVNIEREKEGLKPLEWDTTLENMAKIRAEEIADTFSHTRPDGTPFYTIFGIEIGKNYYYGENAHYGASSAINAMKRWMNSSGHRDNILEQSFKTIGVGCYEDSDGKCYWIQIFSR